MTWVTAECGPYQLVLLMSSSSSEAFSAARFKRILHQMCLFDCIVVKSAKWGLRHAYMCGWLSSELKDGQSLDVLVFLAVKVSDII